MPELPEVETIARTLAPQVKNAMIITGDLLRRATLHPLSLPIASVKNCRISAVKRRGKLLMIGLAPPDLSSPTLLIAHLRMTGRMKVVPAGEKPGKHTRCIFHLEMPGIQKELFFDDIRAFGQIFLCTESMLDDWEFWRSLGPEPFSLGNEDFHLRLKGKRPIKNSLLDQKVIAGLGNIYADESLFAAGINPMRPACSLSSLEASRLLEQIRLILADAISKRGSSIRDYRDAEGKSGEFQKGFYVYGRGGLLCKKCASPLVRIRLGGRSTVYCPNCQAE